MPQYNYMPLEPCVQSPVSHLCSIPFDLKTSLFSSSSHSHAPKPIPKQLPMIQKPPRRMSPIQTLNIMQKQTTITHDIISVQYIGQPAGIPQSPTRVSMSPQLVCTSPSSPMEEVPSPSSSPELVFKPYIPHLLCKNKPATAQANYNNGPWTQSEHEAFLLGFKTVGRQWKTISQMFVKTRDRRQVSSHAQKYFRRLKQIEEEESLRNKELIEPQFHMTHFKF